MSFSNIAIIYNPNSTGPSRKLAETLADKLKAVQPAPVELIATQRAGHAEELATQLASASSRPLIISSSGDGGYHEVVNGVMKAPHNADHAPVAAVLPAGNANDHRRTLARAPLFESIMANRIAQLDLLKVELKTDGQPARTRYAHSYAGLGLTPVVAAELNRHSLTAWRELAIVLRAFFHFRPVLIDVAGRSQRVDSLIFSNIGQMAKILTLAIDAQPTDGQIAITTFPAKGKLQLLWHLLRAATTGLWADTHAKQYQFTVLRAVPMQLDGEVIELPANATVAVSAVPRALETVL